MPARPCPDCQVPLQPLFLERSGKPDVQIDRCHACGGLWFDGGELEQAVERPLAQDALGAPTDRRCPTCTTTMETVLLPGAVPAETCSSCRGVWLDAGELEELGGPKPKQPSRGPTPRSQAPARRTRRAAMAGAAAVGAASKQKLELSTEDFDVSGMDEEDDTPEPSGGFECAGCGQRAPFSDAHGTAKGLVCGRCTPQVQEMPPAPDVEIGTTRGYMGRTYINRFDITALNFGKLFGYFRR